MPASSESSTKASSSPAGAAGAPRRPLAPPRGYIWTLGDGYRAFGRAWGAAKTGAEGGGRRGGAGVIYLHGIQSHGGWYEWSASLLAEAGLMVILPDRRGSGRNSVARGDAPSTQRLLADLDEIAAWAQRDLGIARFGVAAVSWGGKPGLAWAVQRSQWVSHLLLIAPGFFPQVDVSIATKVRIGLAWALRPKALFPIPLNDPALFTENPAGRRFIRDDALKLTHATARFLKHSRDLDASLARLRPGSVAAETTLLLAEGDRIIRNDRTEAWVNRVARVPPTVTRFAAAGHTLEFEFDPGAYEAALAGWARRVAGA